MICHASYGDVRNANVMRMSVTAKSLLPHSFTDSHNYVCIDKY